MFKEQQTGRFVILFHDLPSSAERDSHWDLMLENNGTLETWAMDGLITEQQSASAIKLPPHRIAYLDYEGEVSNNRGTVKRVVEGDFRIKRRLDFGFQIYLATKKATHTIELAKQSGTHWKLTQIT